MEPAPEDLFRLIQSLKTQLERTASKLSHLQEELPKLRQELATLRTTLTPPAGE